VTGEAQSLPGEDASRGAARAVLRRSFRIYLYFLAFSGVVLVAGLTVPPMVFTPGPAERAARAERLLALFLAVMFVAATIVNAGIRSAARIVAARRYRRADVYPAAVVAAASHWASLGVYAVVEAAALYFRVAAHGSAAVFVASVVIPAAAAYHFLRLPRFLTKGVFETGRGRAGPSRKETPC